MIKKLLLLFILVTFYSCCPIHKKTIIVESLEGQSVTLDSAYYGPKALLLHNNLLFTWSKSPEETCCIGFLSEDSLSEWQGGFRRGNGPNEFQKVALAAGRDSSVYITALPSTRNKLLSVIKMGKVQNIESVKNPEAWKTYNLENLPSFRCITDCFISLSDSTMLIPGAPYDDLGHLMSIVDFKNQIIKPLNYWPEDGNKCHEHAKHCIYTDNCQLLGNGKTRYLYLCGEGNLAFIFTIDGSDIRVKKELYSEYPHYEQMGDDMIGRMNYIIRSRPIRSLRPDTNESRIYVLVVENDLNGNMSEKYDDSVCGNTVEVYDWDGNLEKIIKLDKYGKNIKVTEDDRLLYLFSENWETGEPQIWAYDLRN